jgi:hypothetical protein
MCNVSVGGQLQSRVEIEGLAKIFFNKWGYYLTLLFLIISLQATNISSIIISAQVNRSPLALCNTSGLGWACVLTGVNGFCADAHMYIHVQTVDFALVAMFKYTCGLEFYPDFGYDSVTTAGHGTLGLFMRRHVFVVCPLTLRWLLPPSV